jgi:hypothetical protein
MFIRTAIVITLTLHAFQITARTALGQVSPYKASYVCNLAKIYRLKTGHYVSVHSSPTQRSSKIDQLTNDTVVYICDEEEGWLKVSYGSRKNPCGPAAPIDGLDISKTTACKSGWVRREWVNIISG